MLHISHKILAWCSSVRSRKCIFRQAPSSFRRSRFASIQFQHFLAPVIPAQQNVLLYFHLFFAEIFVDVRCLCSIHAIASFSLLFGHSWNAPIQSRIGSFIGFSIGDLCTQYMHVHTSPTTASEPKLILQVRRWQAWPQHTGRVLIFIFDSTLCVLLLRSCVFSLFSRSFSSSK